MRLMTAGATLLLLSAAPAMAQSSAPITPAAAIAAASAASSGTAQVVVEFVAASTGASGFNTYLNSAADYHDPANLSAELHPAVTNALRQKFGGYPEDTLKGKRVRISGVVRRVPIPKKDGGTYYQTRIDVDTVNQIEVLG